MSKRKESDERNFMMRCIQTDSVSSLILAQFVDDKDSSENAFKVKNYKYGGPLVEDLELGSDCGALQSSGGNISAAIATVSSYKIDFNLHEDGLHIQSNCQLKDQIFGIPDVRDVADAVHRELVKTLIDKEYETWLEQPRHGIATRRSNQHFCKDIVVKMLLVN